MRGAPFLALLLAGCVAPVAVVPPPVVLAPEQRTVAQEIAATPALSRFAAALATSGDARAAAGSVTAFAASDAAYARLAPGIADALLAPENRDTLGRFVAYHLVAGSIGTAELRRRVAAGGGRAMLPTLSGEALAVTLTGDVVTLTDGDGDRAYLTGTEVVRPDGVLHIVDGFLAPTLP